jgi:hypothetical protein
VNFDADRKYAPILRMEWIIEMIPTTATELNLIDFEEPRNDLLFSDVTTQPIASNTNPSVLITFWK